MKTSLILLTLSGIVLIDFLKKNRAILIYLPLIIYWLILFIATSLPTDYIPSVGVGDKFSHFFAYMVLSVLLYFTFSLQTRSEILKKYPAIMTILVGSVYGILDELHQMLIPGRSAEFLDWIADFVGTIVGVLLARLLYRIFSDMNGRRKS